MENFASQMNQIAVENSGENLVENSLSIPNFATIDNSSTETDDDELDDDPEEDEEEENDRNNDEDPEEEDKDEDGIEDEIEEENEREIRFDIEDSYVAIESELKSGESENEIKFELATEEDGASAKVEFNNETTSTESEIELKVKFRRIYEFLDLDGDQVFNETQDQIIQVYNLNNFQPINYEERVQPDNSTLYYLNVSTSDGVFTLHFFISGVFQKLHNTTLTPTQLKMDIEINNFPFLNDTSLLALQTKLETEEEYEKEQDTEDEEEGYAQNEEGISTTTSGDFAGFFTWAEYAMVDGQELPVRSSLVEIDDEGGETEEKIYLNYPHGISIYHDPKVGIAGIIIKSPTSSLGNLLDSIPGYSVWILIFAFGISLLLLQKTRK